MSPVWPLEACSKINQGWQASVKTPGNKALSSCVCTDSKLRSALAACCFALHTLESLKSAKNRLYLGLEFGWGTTDWSQLIARAANTDEFSMVSLSAPIAAHDGGFVYGVMLGYEVQSYFAWEMNYMRFPNTRVNFDPISLYSIDVMTSRTHAYNLIGKFSVPISTLNLRGFSSMGVSLIRRHDVLSSTNHLCPTFGAGMSYFFKRHIMAELAFQYYAGYGKAVIRPAINYIPFLYTVHLKLGYRF